MILLSGIQVRDKLKERLKIKVASLDVLPKLVIFQVGENKESDIYINHKKKFGEELGIVVEHKKFPDDVKEDEVVGVIQSYNKDSKVGGIIVQLPMPKHLNRSKILNAIDIEKDVDGLGSGQIGLLYSGDKNAIVPATARGVISLLDFYKINLESKHVVVIGRSNLVGRPVVQMCLNRNATVTVCHSHTKNLESITKTADILIVACGKMRFIDSSYVKEGQVIIDVGIHRTEAGICGDVDFDSVKDMVSAISPVPGGVGPLTVVSLFQNLVDAWKL
jgi:methylenetetrahydrofolate dehydrogenase (NADP+)/methenyltetrahydrofolate cyclohydrolase